MAKRIERVEIVARPRGRGRKKRTGILAYHKFTKGGRVAGRIVYPQQPDGRRPTEYLPGAYESDEMMAAYNRSMGHWLTHKTLPPWVAEKKRRRRRPPTVRKVLGIGMTVREVCYQYRDYRAKLGNLTPKELDAHGYAYAPFCKLFGDEPARELGVAQLIEWQEHARDTRGNCAGTVNSYGFRIMRAFEHASKLKQISREQLAALKELEPLSIYTAEGDPEREPVGPVYRDDIEATLEHLPEAAADLVRVMRGCGARGGELVRMPADELQQIEPDVWAWFPIAHKTSKKRSKNGKKRPRSIMFGPPEIEIIARRIGPYKIRRERALGAQIMRVVPDNLPQHNRVFCKPEFDSQNAKYSGQPYDMYTFRSAILRACDKAGVDRWSPHQLRHAACSELYNSGIPIADVMAMVGHTSISTTENYITPDLSGLVKLAKVRK